MPFGTQPYAFTTTIESIVNYWDAKGTGIETDSFIAPYSLFQTLNMEGLKLFSWFVKTSLGGDIDRYIGQIEIQIFRVVQ